MLRIFFKFKRKLLGDLCRLALRALTRYFEIVTGSALSPGVIAAGGRIRGFIVVLDDFLGRQNRQTKHPSLQASAVTISETESIRKPPGFAMSLHRSLIILEFAHSCLEYGVASNSL